MILLGAEPATQSDSTWCSSTQPLYNVSSAEIQPIRHANVNSDVNLISKTL